MSLLPIGRLQRVCSTAPIIAARAESIPLTTRRGGPDGRGDERLYLTDHGALAVEGDRDGRAGHRCRTLVQEQAGRIADTLDSVVVHLKTADLVGGAEPVLDPAHHAQARRVITFEMQHHVDQMLQGTRARDGAVLGHVPDQDHGHSRVSDSGLGVARQRRGHRTHLGDPSGHAVGLGGGHGLHRIDDHQARFDLLDVTESDLQVGFACQVDVLVGTAGAFGAQPDLASRTPRRTGTAPVGRCVPSGWRPPGAGWTCRRPVHRPAA